MDGESYNVRMHDAKMNCKKVRSTMKWHGQLIYTSRVMSGLDLTKRVCNKRCMYLPELSKKYEDTNNVPFLLSACDLPY